MDVVVNMVGAVAVVAVALGAVAELHLGVAEVGLAAHSTLVEVLGLGLGLGVVEVDHLGPGTGALVGVLVLLLAHLALGPAPPVGELAANVRREEEQVVEHCHNGDQCQERVAGEQVLE